MISLSDFPYGSGDGATVYVGSDRYPATITEIAVLPSIGVVVTIQEDKHRALNVVNYGEDNEYEFTPNSEGRRFKVTHFHTKKRTGWYIVAVSLAEMENRFAACQPSRLVSFGKRSYYYDPHI